MFQRVSPGCTSRLAGGAVALPPLSRLQGCVARTSARSAEQRRRGGACAMELASSRNACLDLRPFALRSRRRRLAISGRAPQLLPFDRPTCRSSPRRPACVLPTFAGRRYAVLRERKKRPSRRLNGKGHGTWRVCRGNSPTAARGSEFLRGAEPPSPLIALPTSRALGRRRGFDPTPHSLDRQDWRRR